MKALEFDIQEAKKIGSFASQITEQFPNLNVLINNAGMMKFEKLESGDTLHDDVLEIIPPYVQTELTGSHQATDPNAMPLDEFIAEIMDILINKPEAKEICVNRVKVLVEAAKNGKEKYDQFVFDFNTQMAATRKQP